MDVRRRNASQGIRSEVAKGGGVSPGPPFPPSPQVACSNPIRHLNGWGEGGWGGGGEGGADQRRLISLEFEFLRFGWRGFQGTDRQGRLVGRGRERASEQGEIWLCQRSDRCGPRRKGESRMLCFWGARAHHPFAEPFYFLSFSATRSLSLTVVVAGTSLWGRGGCCPFPLPAPMLSERATRTRFTMVRSGDGEGEHLWDRIHRSLVLSSVGLCSEWTDNQPW
ncbi:hypothetical protein IE53DRAFT_156375 [Violaceomyces palustris]|uniref:Uncharacterized protein n=1 Tax=Violaceomyces palustris TaxID=1673888 RepID=A0ACD0NTV6_9BASI|nr:hypothetical protein IE53DRAFT_156375 [Violaceomyces palustris]